MGSQNKIWWRVLPCAGAGLLLLTRFGATTHAADPPANPSSPPPKVVTYKAGAAQWLSAPRSVELSQGVTFGQDDATLQTDAATALLDKNQNLISAQAAGPVHIFDPQDDLTGKHGTIDFTRHLAKLQDSIVLVVKPGAREANASEGSPRRQFKDPATLTCQIMTYDYRHKIGQVPGPLTVTQVVQTKDGQETRILTADAGLYNGKAQIIQLVGNILVTNSDGSKVIADTRPSGKPVIVGIKEGAEYIKVDFPTAGKFPLKNEGTSPDTSTDDPDLTTVPQPPPPAPASAAKP